MESQIIQRIKASQGIGSGKECKDMEEVYLNGAIGQEEAPGFLNA